MIEIPDKLMGRKITRRGAHLHPSGNHGDWLKESELWSERLQSMYISWAVVCTDDGAALPGYIEDGKWTPGEGSQVDKYGRSAVEVLLDSGIIPIIRFQPSNLPKNFTPFEWVCGFAETCYHRGVPAFVQLANEHRDAREWHDGKVPWNHFQLYSQWFMKTANECIWPYGAIAITADEPFHTQNPFKWYDDDTLRAFEDGKAVFGLHAYAHNTPFNYPYDTAVTMGEKLTWKEYCSALEPYTLDSAWHDPSFEMVNEVRAAKIDPCPDVMDYPVCWNSWQRIAIWMEETFGKVLPMAMTEGGWTPGAVHDTRYPRMAHYEVAKNTLLMYEDKDAPFFAICPWLLADALMCGGHAVGWEGDAWFSSAYRDKFPDDVMPVVQILMDNPPGNGNEPEVDWKKILGIVTDIRDDIDANL